MNLDSILGFVGVIAFFTKIPIHIYLLKSYTDKEYNWSGFSPAGPDKYLFLLPVIIPVAKKHYYLKLIANVLYWTFMILITFIIIRSN